MHKAQNYFSLNAKYEASETFVDRRPQHCRLSCGKQLRHRGANARLQLFKNGIFNAQSQCKSARMRTSKLLGKRSAPNGHEEIAHKQVLKRTNDFPSYGFRKNGTAARPFCVRLHMLSKTCLEPLGIWIGLSQSCAIRNHGIYVCGRLTQVL